MTNITNTRKSYPDNRTTYPAAIDSNPQPEDSILSAGDFIPEFYFPREINNMFNILNAALSQGRYAGTNTVRQVSLLKNNGLKTVISKPHNLYTELDDSGKVLKYMLKIVYTPFPKTDVHVTVEGNNLVISIGSANLPEEKSCVYHGISGQCEKSIIYLIDPAIDKEHITACCNDGILTIEIPVVKQEARTIEIV